MLPSLNAPSLPVIPRTQVFTEDADQRRPKSPWDLAPPADARLRALLSYPGVERNVLGGPRRADWGPHSDRAVKDSRESKRVALRTA